MSSTLQSPKARYAALCRHRSPDDPEVLAAATELRAAVLADHIRRVVDAAPPLSEAQRARLSVLLMGGASG